MLDEMTNADFICLLNDCPSTDQQEIFEEAARRIRKLESQVKAWEKAAWDSASVETPDELKHFIYSVENS
jgi:hypothetical protein